MPTIYHFDADRIWDNQTREISDAEGAPHGWTFERPPQVPKGKFASFFGPEWVIIDARPEPPEPVQDASQKLTAPKVI